MDDDFNTPEAIAVLFDVVRDINKYRDTVPARAADAGAALRHFAGVIGLLRSDPEHYFRAARLEIRAGVSIAESSGAAVQAAKPGCTSPTRLSSG